MTSMDALTAADHAVRIRYGPGHTGIVKLAVETAMPDGFITASAPEAAAAVEQVRHRLAQLELVLQDVLGRFKLGDRGWRAYVGKTQMDEWQDKLGGGE